MYYYKIINNNGTLCSLEESQTKRQGLTLPDGKIFVEISQEEYLGIIIPLLENK